MSDTFDVFLSYHWRDHAQVESLARRLREAGLRVFLDRWYLVPGTNWVNALDTTLTRCRSVAVCLGAEVGPWQQREQYSALERQVAEERSGTAFPVIPVLLPGADSPLGFLRQNTWVDLRANLDDPVRFMVLTRAIRGEPPGPEAQSAVQQTLSQVCPYRGLLYFREQDATFYYGRAAVVAQLVTAVGQHPLVAVVGASGSGKSSVVRAGLLPHLRESRSPVWEIATLVPTDRPLQALAAALLPLLEPEMSEVTRLGEISRLAGQFADGATTLRDVVDRVLAKQPGTERLMLVVDQWEELFTLTQEDSARLHFIDAVLEATERAKLSVVLTVRGDFFGRAITGHRRLSDRLQGAQVNLGPMTQRELREAMEGPADKVGLMFEPGLVDAILADVGDEPGNLPLLEFVLRELWEQRQGALMHKAAYETMGRLQGAIAQKADSLYHRLIQKDPQAARRLQSVFLRLVRPGEGERDTRRRATASEFDSRTAALIRQLSDERLLVTSKAKTDDTETVEVAHEALIQNWQQLREWVSADRQFMIWQERLNVRALEWDRQKHSADLLMRGLPLAEARDWQAKRPDDLSALERDFITASGQRRRRMCAAGAAVTAAIAIVMIVTGAWIIHQTRAVALQTSLVLASAATMANDAGFYDRGMRFAILAMGMNWLSPGSAEAEQELVRGAHASMQIAQLSGHQGAVASAAFSPDGQRVVTASLDWTARVWDATTGKQIALFSGHQGTVYSAAFSPDGRRVVTSSYDRTARVWDATTGQMTALLSGHEERVVSAAFSPDSRRVVTASWDRTARVWDATTGQMTAQLSGHQGTVYSAAFSPDGQRVVTASRDRTARVWDAMTGRQIALLSGHQGTVLSAAFSPDGQRVVTASRDRTARVWDATTGQMTALLGGHQDRVVSAAFSPDGQRVVTASSDGTARVWDATTGRQIALFSGHEEPLVSAAFSPDGQRVVTASYDKTARVWDAMTGQMTALLRGHEDRVVSAAFSPDDRRVVTASSDRTARVWDATTGKRIALFSGNQEPVVSAAFSPDGQRVATASYDKTARVWDATTGQMTALLGGHQDRVVSAAFSPDGQRVVTASWDRTARVWDATTGQTIAQFSGHQEPVVSAAFSPDGQRVVTASYDKTARVWDASTGMQIALLSGHEDRVVSAAFSPDGQRVLTASLDRTARVWDATTGQMIALLRGNREPVVSAAFSPDGRRVVTASSDRTARVWDATTGQMIALLGGHQGTVLSAAFSPDGQRVVTASSDGTARVWDATTRQTIAPLTGHQGVVYSAAFSPDGRRVVTASSDRTARVWDATTGQMIALLSGHQGAVVSAAFSPDGQRVVTASRDATARVWSIRWLMQYRGRSLAEAVCKEKLVGANLLTADDEAALSLIRRRQGENVCGS
ncbi:nSTAND1 domain-containing NTPase [Paraburkholderia sp. HD33-4]|uniref:nSTAND1 domain-containing NTPase n=1 Tax=Paraburkholderia sp. HD33-4 TaxID=2883242 RepID=UPI001F47F909|nr:TIR domain-containing protein [Paraburkholderia sp. HD33-4]